MKEAIPGKFDPPIAEPLLQIGVVLEEDKKLTVTIEHTSGGLRLISPDGNEQQIEKSLEISLDDNAIIAESSEHEEILRGASLRIEPTGTKTRSCTPQEGIRIRDVVAGRSFHWRKEIEQIYPGIITVHPAPTGLIVVNEVPFENYLACVISSEMSAECPPDFIKAQAVSARSWAYVFLHNKHEGLPYTICNDDDCQRYQGTTHISQACIDAVRECAGEFLIDSKGKVLPAYYSKSCGGHSEDPKSCFGLDIPDLVSVLDAPADSALSQLNPQHESEISSWVDAENPAVENAWCSEARVPRDDLPKYLGAVDEPGSYFRWKERIAPELVLDNLQKKFSLQEAVRVEHLALHSRGSSGRYLTGEVSYTTSSGERKTFAIENQYALRQLLHASFLFSTAFELEEERTEDGELSTFALRGAGWGHGVGLCQIGALGMSLAQNDYQTILAHYFPKGTLQGAYNIDR